MNRTVVQWEHALDARWLMPHRILAYLILFIWCSVGAGAQNAGQPPNLPAPFSTRVTHLLGFAGAKNNANGTLSIHDSALQFQKEGRQAAEVSIASVQDIFLGDQSRQVGGVPMTLGKAATPFGGGRVVSLFAHKKYDTLSIDYVDANGGVHGAIFQLKKGQGVSLRDGLVARGAHVHQSEGEATKESTAEVSSDHK